MFFVLLFTSFVVLCIFCISYYTESIKGGGERQRVIAKIEIIVIIIIIIVVVIVIIIVIMIIIMIIIVIIILGVLRGAASAREAAVHGAAARVAP